MSNQFTGEIRLFAGNFAPVDWHFCDGSLLPISDYQVLYTLVGTTYGGDGQTTFALPDLRSRIPIHMGTDPGASTFVLGQAAGVESVALTVNNLPQHSHAVAGSSTGGSNNPSGNAYGGGQSLFSSAAPSVALSPATVGFSGSSVPHTNIMPYQCVNYIIALFGNFPTP